MDIKITTRDIFLKQDSKIVTELYSTLKALWEELEIYMPIPSCTCLILYLCGDMKQERNNHNFLYAIRFLTGLNGNSTAVKSQILLMDLLPNMNKIFFLWFFNMKDKRILLHYKILKH